MSSSSLVMIPVDGSEHSERAFDWYLKYMHKPEHTVAITHVHEMKHAVVRVPMGSDSPEAAAENALQAHWNKVEEMVDKFKQKCEAAKVSYTALIETEGKPGDVICKLAKEKNALQIVMGSRGLGMIRRTFLGSVSQQVIDHAHIPVTIIPPEKEN